MGSNRCERHLVFVSGPKPDNFTSFVERIVLSLLYSLFSFHSVSVLVFLPIDSSSVMRDANSSKLFVKLWLIGSQSSCELRLGFTIP